MENKDQLEKVEKPELESSEKSKSQTVDEQLNVEETPSQEEDSADNTLASRVIPKRWSYTGKGKSNF